MGVLDAITLIPQSMVTSVIMGITTAIAINIYGSSRGILLGFVLMSLNSMMRH